MAFIRLLSMVVLPLVVASLAGGMASLGDIRAVGRVGAKTLLYYVATTVVAVLLGLLLVNLFLSRRDARRGVPLVVARSTGAESMPRAWPRSGEKTTPAVNAARHHPRNFFEAVAKGEDAPVIVFSLFFGAALAAIGRDKAPLIELLASVNER